MNWFRLSWIGGLWAPYIDQIKYIIGMGRSGRRYRPPTKPRQAQPWELRSQAASLNATPAWQRRPSRHWRRESKDRWQGERRAC